MALSGPVPLFPLPNVVLLPRAVLPLHVFEDRYKKMTADVVAGDRQLAMALLQDGWEKDYYGRPAIEPVVCVGTILSWEKLADGRYNFLIQGHTRATVLREVRGGEYRTAELAAIEQSPTLEIDLECQRQRLREMFGQGPLAHLPGSDQFRQLVASTIPTSDLADLLAFNLLEDLPLKQSLLASSDVRGRVSRVVDELTRLVERVHSGMHGFPSDPSVN